MSEGIPIPSKWGRYCANCGEHHAPGTCPRLSASTTVGSVSLATATEVAALRERMAELEAEVERLKAFLVSLQGSDTCNVFEAARKDKKR